MGILNYVPTFKVVEPNRLTALNTGQVLSQFVADQGNEADLFTTKNETYFLENGVILGLNNDLEIGAYSAEDGNDDNPAPSHPQPFLHYTEELVTMLSGNNKFALEADEDDQCYPRGLALYVGDTFTTDNYTEDLPESTAGTDPTAAATVDLTTEAAFATVIDGEIILQETKDQNEYKSIFAAEASTLPTGEDAVRVTYLGA